MSLDLLHPAELLWGLLALPIAALYYWTFRRQREEVATYSLWTRALARRSAWSRWRRLVSLAAQLAVLALLVLSLTGLDWSPRSRGARSVVLVIDTSKSMQATDAPPSRFDQAVAAARGIVEGLSRNERAAILSSGGQPGVMCGLTSNKQRLNEALGRLSAGNEAGRIEPAVELAEGMIERQPNGRIIVLTDGRFDGASKLAARVNVEVRIFSGAANNVALTRLAARPSLVKDEHEILVEAVNFSPQPAVVSVELSLAGQRLETIPLDMSAGRTRQEIVKRKLPTAGPLMARLTTSDKFPLDDSATTQVAPRPQTKILLVGSEQSPLAAALRAIPQTTLQVVPNLSQPLETADVTVLDGLAPAGSISGNLFVIAPAGACELWEHEGTVEGRFEVQSTEGEPPLAGVDLSGVVIEELVRLSFKTPARSLVATAAGEPLLSLIERPDSRVLVWHAPLDKSDLSQQTAYPLLVAHAVRWLAPSKGWEGPAHVFDRRESDLRFAEDLPEVKDTPRRPWFDEPLWMAFLVLAVALAAVDWVLLHRRTLV